MEGTWIRTTPLSRLPPLEFGDLRFETDEPFPEPDAVLLVGHTDPDEFQESHNGVTQPIFGTTWVENHTVSVVVDNRTKTDPYGRLDTSR